MDDAARVGLGDAGARLKDVVSRLANAEAPALVQQRPEVRSLELLHHDEGVALAIAADVHHADHVLAVQRERGARLADHPLDADGGGVAKELDGDALLQLGVHRGHDKPRRAHPEL